MVIYMVASSVENCGAKEMIEVAFGGELVEDVGRSALWWSVMSLSRETVLMSGLEMLDMASNGPGVDRGWSSDGSVEWSRVGTEEVRVELWSDNVGGVARNRDEAMARRRRSSLSWLELD
ncbi:hypothetical protein M6B38_179360 [Iris pallida]|uniref:Uncharacterized protein n=1 Tax=Iris pallida TaxID=29817 RepID=A0AAX6EMP4_IRIPA|nr:hypothetical protein M6B38_179360 [Iris pallida]